MQRYVIATISAAMLSAVVLAAAQSRQPGQTADIIFTNGAIVTLDGASTVAKMLAIADDKILAVGSADAVLAHRGPNTRVIDLHGKTIIPGLQDSHIHFRTLGRDLTTRAELTFARNPKEIVKTVSDLKLKLNPKPGEWILGSRWDQSKYATPVTRWQLDEVSADNPVRLSRVYRGVLVNTATFRLMGIDDQKSSTWPVWWTKDPADFTFEDKIVREKRSLIVDGVRKEMDVPTGMFLGRKGTTLVTARPPADDMASDVLSVKAGVKEMLRFGVTAILDADSRNDYDMRVYQESYKRGELLIRVPGVYFGSVYKQKPAEFAALLKPVNMHDPDNGFLRWRGVKFYADGGAGTRSAWISEPFARWQDLEHKENFGEPEVPDNAVREAQYRAVADLGWDLHTHAAGDVAMRQTVSLYMKLLDEIHAKRPSADLRWSVIHAYLPIEAKTSVLADMAKYHIVAVPNPVFNWQQGKGFADNLGEARMARTQPFRSYLKAGVMMPSGSDYPITSPDPWLGIYAMVTRRDQATGRVYGPSETVGILDALRSYTTHGAYLTYDEKTRGSLEAGKLADLVVLDLPDIMQLEKRPDLLLQMADRVAMTLVGGKILYEKSGTP